MDILRFKDHTYFDADHASYVWWHGATINVIDGLGDEIDVFTLYGDSEGNPPNEDQVIDAIFRYESDYYC